jgi:phosphohistidine phosphatase SixA
VIGETAAAVSTLVVVGHNPGIERLAWELDDGQDARELTDRGLPTSAVAVFEVPGWDLERAVLREVATPRGS